MWNGRPWVILREVKQKNVMKPVHWTQAKYQRSVCGSVELLAMLWILLSMETNIFFFFSYKNWIVKSHFGWNITLLLWKTNLGSKIMSCEPSLSLTSPRNGRKTFCPILFIIFFFHWIPGKYLAGSFLSLFFPDSWVGGLVLIFPNPEWLLQFPSLGTLYFNIN